MSNERLTKSTMQDKIVIITNIKKEKDQMDTNIFRKLSYGVYVISTWDNGRPTGCTANSAMQITSSPATIAVSVNHDN